jgi:hypothetical protein
MQLRGQAPVATAEVNDQAALDAGLLEDFFGGRFRARKLAQKQGQHQSMEQPQVHDCDVNTVQLPELLRLFSRPRGRQGPFSERSGGVDGDLIKKAK